MSNNEETSKSTDRLEDDVADSASPREELNESGKPSLLEVVLSVMAAFVGIQNKKNKERDFKHGNFKVFVVVAAVFTLLFLLTIITIVQIVIGK